MSWHADKKKFALVVCLTLSALLLLCVPALAQTPPPPPSVPQTVVLSAPQIEVFTSTARVFSLLLGLIAGLLAGDL